MYMEKWMLSYILFDAIDGQHMAGGNADLLSRGGLCTCCLLLEAGLQISDLFPQLLCLSIGLQACTVKLTDPCCCKSGGG